MTYDEFKNAAFQQISERMQENCTVELAVFRKNNDVLLDCLQIKEKNVNISPSIYLNYYYDRLANGVEFERIIEEIIDFYQKHKKSKSVDFDFYLDYENVKNRITYKLVNKNKNEKLLGEVPHVEFDEDLVIIFSYLLEDSKNNLVQTITVKNEHLHIWNKTAADLLQVAKKNTPALMGYRLRNINDVLIDKFGEARCNMIFGDELLMPQIYVVSNVSNINGAAVVLYDRVLSDLAEMVEDDIYVIFSSVHEIIVFPKNKIFIGSSNYIKETIRFINLNEVTAEEVLSDNLYAYYRQTNELMAV